MAHVRDSKLARLAELSDEQLACRAGRHSWPIMVPGRKIPKGIYATRYPEDGSYQITETCEICDETRVMVTLPNGVYDANAKYAYTYPKSWVRFSIDEEITRADIKGEYYRRVGKALFK